MDLRTGPPAAERGTRARSLRGAILARAPSSCPHDHDRLRIPPTPSSRTSGTEKKESTAHRLNRASRPCATPSSNSSFDHDLSDVPTAEDKSAKSNGVNKSAKVVLGRVLINPECPLTWRCPHYPRYCCKSLFGRTKFLEPLMRFASGDVRDHIVSSKTDQGPPWWS